MQPSTNLDGKECMLLELGWARRTVARGLIQSADPRQIVHGKPMGEGNLHIALIHVVESTTQLFMRDGFHNTIGEVSVGGYVVWPRHSVEINL